MQIAHPIQVLSGALDAQWVLGYRHRREAYLVVDGEYHAVDDPRGPRLVETGRQFAPSRMGLLFFLLLLPVSILFCRYLLWAVCLEIHLPDARRIRQLCGYDVWRQVRNRIATHDRRAGESRG